MVDNGTSILQQSFTYDNNNNITAITEGNSTKTFDYDADNQLTRSITPGKYLESDPTPGTSKIPSRQKKNLTKKLGSYF